MILRVKRLRHSRMAASVLAVIAAWTYLISTHAAEPASTITGTDGSVMQLVPEGVFTMGQLQGAPEESPPHQIVLPAFYIDRTEVTVRQYAQFIIATGHPAPVGWRDNHPPAGIEEQPITNITWSDAMQYAVWSGKRLPTEAEWEKAARGADGRNYPWGDADNAALRNRDTGKMMAVAHYPDGASPCGCLDMSGNAWEWTSDWFAAYPNSRARSVHFGRGYKVVRGGGGEYLYATVNTGTCTQRARLVPYGSHDFIGFRCVKDFPGQSPPYNPADLLREAAELLKGSLGEPRALVHEQQFAELNQVGRIPLQVQGASGLQELVVSGLPLPKGRIRNAADVELLDDSDQAIACANSVLSSWPDGSARWVLLRFMAKGGDKLTARLSAAERAATASETSNRAAIRITEQGQDFQIDTGDMSLQLSRDVLIKGLKLGERTICAGTILDLDLCEGETTRRLQAGPATDFQVVSQSPLHAEIRWQGPLTDSEGKPGPFTYDLRLRAAAGSHRLRAWLTVLYARPRTQPWDDRQPQCQVANWRWGLRLPQPAGVLLFGTERTPVRCAAAESVGLYQSDDLHYEVKLGQQTLAQGTRSAGWISAGLGDAAITLGVRHFWQNHSKRLFSDGPVIGAQLWAGSDPFVWEGGLAKTHELVIDVAAACPADFETTPLYAVPPPQWMCGTQAAGALLPRNEQALRQLAYWECWRETAIRNWVNAMPTGMRDFGDAYLGGPYKGRHAYANLEYDVAMDFLHEFLRTGDAWYLEAAEPLARHQADIDTENVTGLAWKHSPLHTTTEAEFGHVFLRGLLLHHLLTGDSRSLEIAMKAGDRIADSLLHGRGVGNERQIGWSLYALTALYDVTRKPEYLQGAQALSQQLVRDQAPTGRFNIRWDNRIAFFNGIAMNGLLGVDEIAPDAQLEQGVLRVAARTLGMYPDYACRTLNAYCWALERTHDARYLDNMHRSWISSLEFLMNRDALTSETHAWRYPSFAVEYNLFPQLPADETFLPQADTWRSLRLKQPHAEIYVQAANGQPAPLLVVREGLARGAAELFDSQGRSVERVEQVDSAQLVQSSVLRVPGESPWYRLCLDSEDAYAWQIHSDHRTKIIVVDRANQLLPDILPRAYGSAESGATEISVRFAAQGEGFHSATLFDPQGVPVQRVQKFVEFEDPGRYELQIAVPITGPRDGWSLEIHNLQVVAITGMAPYWSALRESSFHPGKSSVK